VAKEGTNGGRRLKIGTVADRVVGKALHEAWWPFWESRFLDCSYGFRAGRSTWMMLAKLEEQMGRQTRSALAIDDVRKAFDNVPIDEVVGLHAEALADLDQEGFTDEEKKKSIELVEAVLRGHDEKRSRGIDQGGPYSPTALNVLLNHHLDAPMTEHAKSKPLWHRYADNLVYLCGSVTEG